MGTVSLVISKTIPISWKKPVYWVGMKCGGELDLRRAQTAGYCPQCGGRILIACETCMNPIQGHLSGPGILIPSTYNPPDFCLKCGNPHPWASRQARLWHLENLLERENLSTAERLKIHERFENLRSDKISENDEIRHWRYIADKVPALVRVGKPIIANLVSQIVLKKLDL